MGERRHSTFTPHGVAKMIEARARESGSKVIQSRSSKPAFVFEVMAFPPKRPWWKFWVPNRPFMLLKGVEYEVDPETQAVTVFRKRIGWDYRLAFFEAA